MLLVTSFSSSARGSRGASSISIRGIVLTRSPW
jgi:hypothetical protein